MTLLTVKKFSPRKEMINYFEIQKFIRFRSHWYCLGNINFYYNWFGNLPDIKFIRRALKPDGSQHWSFLIAKMGRTKKRGAAMSASRSFYSLAYRLSSWLTMLAIISYPPCQNSAWVTSMPASAKSLIGATDPPAERMRKYLGLKLSPSSW